MIKSFPPIINQQTEILVIGTMPGIKSLEMAQYYAHPRNAFWKIINIVFNQSKDFNSYEDKKNCLLANRLGLWDSLQLCLRNGSLDNNIKNEQPNDFKTLLEANPQVRRLLFNGQPAFKFFKKYHSTILENTEYHVLPSTSPANASYSFAEKLEQWQLFLK